MKFLGHANYILNSRAQADGDEIGIAGVNDGAPEVVSARLSQIRDVPPPDIDITRIVNNRVRIQAGFERGQTDDGFENRAGRVIFISRAIGLRTQFRIVHPRRFVGGIIRVDGRRRNHRQYVPRAHIHHDDRRARVRAPMRRQRAFRRLLNVEIHRQHDVVTRFGLAPHVFGLAIAEIVDEHGLRARTSAQFRVEPGLDTDLAAVIGQIVIEVVGILTFFGTIVAQHITEQMRRQRAKRISANGL